jgi:hypothetical protein
LARNSICIERPQPGQKAAESGIWAAHTGHDFNPIAICSIAGNISDRRAGDKIAANQFGALTEAILNSMFRANFDGFRTWELFCNEKIRIAPLMKLLGKGESR